MTTKRQRRELTTAQLRGILKDVDIRRAWRIILAEYTDTALAAKYGVPMGTLKDLLRRRRRLLDTELRERTMSHKPAQAISPGA